MEDRPFTARRSKTQAGAAGAAVNLLMALTLPLVAEYAFGGMVAGWLIGGCFGSLKNWDDIAGSGYGMMAGAVLGLFGPLIAVVMLVVKDRHQHPS